MVTFSFLILFGHYLPLAALQQRRCEFLDDLMFMCSGIFQLCFHIMGKGVLKVYYGP